MFSKQSLVCVLAFGFVSLTFTGCQNRFNQPCGYPYQQPYANGFANQFGYAPTFNNASARSALIPPPATGSINIPSIARNNPYGLNQNRGLLNTNQRAPTPASDRAARFNQQNGWRPTQGSTAPAQSSGSNNSSSGTTLGSNTAIPNTNGTQAPRPVAPSNASSVLVQNQDRLTNGFGESFIRSQDYATTMVDETNDRTRLPATDASAVRAPSQYYARAESARVAQLPPQGFGGVQQPYYSPNQGQSQIGSAYAYNPNATVRVQDQATATYDPYGGNTRSADWRNQNDENESF